MNNQLGSMHTMEHCATVEPVDGGSDNTVAVAAKHGLSPGSQTQKNTQRVVLFRKTSRPR